MVFITRPYVALHRDTRVSSQKPHHVLESIRLCSTHRVQSGTIRNTSMSFPIPLLAHVGVYSVMGNKPGSVIINVANFTQQKTLWWKIHSEVTAKSGSGAADIRENQQRQDFVSKAQGKGSSASILGRCRTGNRYLLSYSHQAESSRAC